MERLHVGIIKRLFRYPLKSMSGEQLSELAVGETGAVGDRAFALRKQDGRLMTAKRSGQLLQFQASYSDGEAAELIVNCPDGRQLKGEELSEGETLSKLLGQKVSLERRQPEQENYGELDARTVFADIPLETALKGKRRQLAPDADRYDLAPGTFFDSAHLHLITTGTLAHLQSLIGPDAEVDVRRFRPNIFIESSPVLSGFIEDEWYDAKLQIGTSVQIHDIWPTLRCVMTTLPQGEIPKDLRILHAIVKNHETNLGAFAAVETAGTIKIGDRVTLLR